MKTLFLAWQDSKREGSTRGWYPIGRLDADPSEKLYRFKYTFGAQKAQKEMGFSPLDAFPKFERVYEAGELFPLFQNRIPSSKRGDYEEFVNRLGLTSRDADPFEILSVTGGERQTDNLEVFPKIIKEADGRFRCRFFVHGWRHVSISAQERLNTLHEGDILRVALEINNPATDIAIQLATADDYHMIGWAPRYLIQDMLKALATRPEKVDATIIRVNPSPAPYNQRVLVELVGHFPDDFEPMSSEEFQEYLH